ncbi:hypothetical protein MTR_5g035790 [Medicago truncatula]|uniref:Uncharacterized protein n=1 Tax=Medicago truncatula TaxID=3880 RepID=G7K483_MEDTR|nr:hypothetical protein MTR_5g035790 [Medicago truncatula]
MQIISKSFIENLVTELVMLYMLRRVFIWDLSHVIVESDSKVLLDIVINNCKPSLLWLDVLRRSFSKIYVLRLFTFGVNVLTN